MKSQYNEIIINTPEDLGISSDYSTNYDVYYSSYEPIKVNDRFKCILSTFCSARASRSLTPTILIRPPTTFKSTTRVNQGHAFLSAPVGFIHVLLHHRIMPGLRQMTNAATLGKNNKC